MRISPAVRNAVHRSPSISTTMSTITTAATRPRARPLTSAAHAPVLSAPPRLLKQAPLVSGSHRTFLPPPSTSTRTTIPQRRAMSSSTTPVASATAMAATSALPPPPPITFPKSPVPKNPLGEGRYIRTAAALIIGDEILNGKTHDRNSHVFAQYCFEHGIDLKRIEVIADDEEEIIEASRRLVEKYDFVVTSGGIGPTHDDITYESLSKSFHQPLHYHPETIHRLTEMTKHRPWVQQQNAEQRKATHRMALLPSGEGVEVLFVGEDLWVPVVRLKSKLCVLPGVPGLFQKLLHLLTPFLSLPPKSERPLRIQVFTDRAESLIAPFLTTLQTRLKPHGIQVGSYPILGQGVFVSLIGRDLVTQGGDGKAKTRVWLAEVAREVEQEIGGKVVSEEEVALKRERSLSNLNLNAVGAAGPNLNVVAGVKVEAATEGEKEKEKAKI